MPWASARPSAATSKVGAASESEARPDEKPCIPGHWQVENFELSLRLSLSYFKSGPAACLRGLGDRRRRSPQCYLALLVPFTTDSG